MNWTNGRAFAVGNILLGHKQLRERYENKKYIFIQEKTPAGSLGTVPLLRQNIPFLLAMPVRFQYLYGLHAGKSVGDVL